MLGDHPVRDHGQYVARLDGHLTGITREFMFEIGGELGIPVRDAVLRDEDLFGADEAFLTSTTNFVLSVVRIDDTPIGNGHPGSVVRRLREAYESYTAAQGQRR